MEALGRGLVAGLLGTAAMTISSTAEAKLSGRGASTTPAQAAGKVAGVVPRDEAGEQRFNTLAHWGYGTAWGNGHFASCGVRRSQRLCIRLPVTRKGLADGRE
jgi:hypothetical protein